MQQPDLDQVIDKEALFEEGVQAVEAEEFAGREGDLSATDLRDYLKTQGVDEEETKGLTDEQLLSEWKKAQEEPADAAAPKVGLDGKPVVATETAAPPWTRPWSFLDKDGKPLTDLRQSKVDDLLGSPIRYKAAEQDQSHTIDQLVRIAQRSVASEQRTQMLVNQRNQASDQFNQLSSEAGTLRKEKETWLEVLMDPTGQKFLDLQTRFFQTGGKAPAAQPGAVAAAEGQPDAAAEAQGELVYRTQIFPYLQQIAGQYGFAGKGADAATTSHLTAELDRIFRDLLVREGRFISDPQYGPWRINQIVTHDLPAMLEESGYSRAAAASAVAEVAGAAGTAGAAAPAGSELAKLKAENENLRTEMARHKIKAAPDAGSGSTAGSTAGSGVDDKVFKSWRTARNALRDSSETFGM